MFSQHYFAPVLLPILIFGNIKQINDRSVDNMKVNQVLMVNFERVNAELTDAKIDEIITFAKASEMLRAILVQSESPRPLATAAINR